MLNHLPFQRLADMAEGRPSSGESAQEEQAHLSSCRQCAAKLKELENVIGLMRTDKAEDASPELLASAVNLFRSRVAPQKPTLVERIVAALSFDSFQMSPVYGVRSGQAAARQLLYTAGENDLDLRIAPSGDRWVVSGQVLGAECSGGQIELEGSYGAERAELNEQCEFRLPAVPSGSYRLRLRLTNQEIEIPQLELKA